MPSKVAMAAAKPILVKCTGTDWSELAGDGIVDQAKVMAWVDVQSELAEIIDRHFKPYLEAVEALRELLPKYEAVTNRQGGILLADQELQRARFALQRIDLK